MGLGKGGSLDNAVIVRGDKVLNNNKDKVEELDKYHNDEVPNWDEDY